MAIIMPAIDKCDFLSLCMISNASITIAAAFSMTMIMTTMTMMTVSYGCVIRAFDHDDYDYDDCFVWMCDSSFRS